MCKNIKVTVICLTYNHEKYIETCIKGFLLQQTTFDFEVIIHDDASTDRTQGIIKKYAEKYPRIIIPILEKENLMSKGVNIVEEIMMPRARGEFIAFCEGDDCWIDKNKLQMQVEYLDLHPEDQNAYELFKKYVKEKNKLEEAYSEKYGPMTITETQGSKYNWIKNPWPWDNTGGSMYV